LNKTREALLQNYVFHSGHVLSSQKLFFLAHYHKALEAGVGISEILLLENGVRWTSLGRFKWQASAFLVLADKPDTVLVLGRDGEIGLITHDTVIEEDRIAQSAVGPTRGLALVGGDPVAFGMKREVFRRRGPSSWERWNQQMNPALPAGMDIAAAIKYRMKTSGGLNALLEGPGHVLYSFGLHGEIWRRSAADGHSTWNAVDSPTNLTFADATLDGDNVIYACGQVGTIVRGLEDRWVSLNYDGPQALDFCNVAWFDNALYVADGHSLRRLRDGTLETVDFGVGAVVPCSHLHATSEALLSVAGKELFITSNGSDWTSLLA